jgi:hypothetical protein
MVLNAADGAAPPAIAAVRLSAVTALRRPLTRAEHDTLVEIIAREAPDHLALAQHAVNARWLDDDECETLTGALLNVFTAHLGPDDEPDTYGAKADDLIGLIQMQRPGYWQQ